MKVTLTRCAVRLELEQGVCYRLNSPKSSTKPTVQVCNYFVWRTPRETLDANTTCSMPSLSFSCSCYDHWWHSFFYAMPESYGRRVTLSWINVTEFGYAALVGAWDECIHPRISFCYFSGSIAVGESIESSCPGTTRRNGNTARGWRRERDSEGSGRRFAALPGLTFNAKSAPISGGTVLTSYVIGEVNGVSWWAFEL